MCEDDHLSGQWILINRSMVFEWPYLKIVSVCCAVQQLQWNELVKPVEHRKCWKQMICKCLCMWNRTFFKRKKNNKVHHWFLFFGHLDRFHCTSMSNLFVLLWRWHWLRISLRQSHFTTQNILLCFIKRRWEKWINYSCTSSSSNSNSNSWRDEARQAHCVHLIARIVENECVWKWIETEKPMISHRF